MSDAWHLAKIKRFEQVLAAPGITLLRVTARPPRRHGTPGERPILLADDGHIVNRYQALPSPRDPKGVLRAAYSVPTSFVTPETVFSLLLDDGAVLSLPAPAEGAARRPTGTAVPLATEIPRAEADVLLAARSPLPPAGDDPDEPEVELDPSPSEVAVSGTVTAPAERRSDIMSRVIELSAALAVAEREAREEREARQALQAELTQRGAEATTASSDAEAARDTALAELESLRGELGQRVAAARAEAEQAAAQERADAEQTRRAAEAELAELREREAALSNELSHVLERARAEVEEEFAAARTELEERAEQAVAAERSAQEAERAARAEAAQATGALTALERRVAGLELSLAEHGEQILTLEAERDDAVRVRDELGREVTSLRSECARLERELHDALDSVRRMAIERDELGRQAAAFDQVAIKARERATEAEEAHARSQAVLSELETWRGELERRLATMSSELGEARSRLSDNDRQLAHMRGQLAEAEAQAELAQAQLRALREQSGGDTTVIETAELERMSDELSALRSADAQTRHELEAASQSRLREVAAERDELAARVGDLTARLDRARSASGGPADAGAHGSQASAASDGDLPTAPGAAASAADDPVQTILPTPPSSAGPPRLMPEPVLRRRSESEQAEIAALSRRAEANAEATATGEITQALLRAR